MLKLGGNLGIDSKDIVNVESYLSEKEKKKKEKVFLFLQGPPGKFFRKLSDKLGNLGYKTYKVNFNCGDLISSRGCDTINFRWSLKEWPQWIEEIINTHGITDIVLYGDCRPYHKITIEIIKKYFGTIHVFEEGYLRPNWITYERDGVNGNSKLTEICLDEVNNEILSSVIGSDKIEKVNYSIWSYIRSGITYYTFCFLGTILFPNYRTHRPLSIKQELLVWLKRIPTLPIKKSQSRKDVENIINGKFDFHLIPLQLSGDYQLRVHSDFVSIEDFISECIKTYSEVKNNEAKLVFKSHPLDAGNNDFEEIINRYANDYNVPEKCIFIDGGKLAPLLDKAKSVVAINSTSCLQSIARGLPTKALGTAIYNHEGLASSQTLYEFFNCPDKPLVDKRNKFNKLLLNTSQIEGSFYDRKGIKMAVSKVSKLILHSEDPYDKFMLEDNNAEIIDLNERLTNK